MTTEQSSNEDYEISPKLQTCFFLTKSNSCSQKNLFCANAVKDSTCEIYVDCIKDKKTLSVGRISCNINFVMFTQSKKVLQRHITFCKNPLD